MPCHGYYLGFDRTGNSAIRSANPEIPNIDTDMNSIGSPVAEIWPFEYSNMAAGRHLGFDRTGNNAIRSADHENPHET